LGLLNDARTELTAKWSATVRRAAKATRLFQNPWFVSSAVRLYNFLAGAKFPLHPGLMCLNSKAQTWQPWLPNEPIGGRIEEIWW